VCIDVPKAEPNREAVPRKTTYSRLAGTPVTVSPAAFR
jgi:hypothetical protein